jgi:hypothetical protein
MAAASTTTGTSIRSRISRIASSCGSSRPGPSTSASLHSASAVALLTESAERTSPVNRSAIRLGESGDDAEGRLGRQHFRDVRSRAEGGDPGERWRTRVLDAPADDAHEAVVALLVGFAAGEAIEQLLHTAGSATRAKCQTVRTGDPVRPGRT